MDPAYVRDPAPPKTDLFQLFQVQYLHFWYLKPLVKKTVVFGEGTQGSPNRCSRGAKWALVISPL